MGDKPRPLPYMSAKSAQWQDKWTYAQPAPRRLGRAARWRFCDEPHSRARKRAVRPTVRSRQADSGIRAGDTVIVNVKVVEGDRSRVQAYEGVCIGRSGGGLNESFTVRKISYGEGVERVFPVM